MIMTMIAICSYHLCMLIRSFLSLIRFVNLTLRKLQNNKRTTKKQQDEIANSDVGKWNAAKDFKYVMPKTLTQCNSRLGLQLWNAQWDVTNKENERELVTPTRLSSK